MHLQDYVIVSKRIKKQVDVIKVKDFPYEAKPLEQNCASEIKDDPHIVEKTFDLEKSSKFPCNKCEVHFDMIWLYSNIIRSPLKS